MMTFEKGQHPTFETCLEKIGVLPVSASKAVSRQDITDFMEHGVRWLGLQREKIEAMTEGAKNHLKEASDRVRLYKLLSKVSHEKLDINDYSLTFGATTFEEMNTQAQAIMEVGDIRRLLTKRFIKTVRGSSYEVDLRLNESISLLHNIRNQLVREITAKLLQVHLSSLHLATWERDSFTVLLTDGLNLTRRSHYEALLQDWLLLQLCKNLPIPPKTCHVLNDVINLIRSTSQLKYIDSKNLTAQINQLESTGDLRPNMNNIKGYTGIRLFTTLSFFKLYNFDDWMLKNSNYLSKDAEDRLQFCGVGTQWKLAIAEEYPRILNGLLDSIKRSKGFQLHLLVDEKACLKDRIISRQIVECCDEKPRHLDVCKRARKIIIVGASIFKSVNILHRIVLKVNFSKFLQKVKEAVESKDFAKAVTTINRMVGKIWVKMSLEMLRSIVKTTKKFKQMCRLCQKLAYIQKLAAKTEAFMHIKRVASRRVQASRNLKIADSLLRNIFKYKLAAKLAYGLNRIKSHASSRRRYMNFLKMTEQLLRERMKSALRQMQQFSIERRTIQKKNELERQSVALLRRNYLLNNMVFIFKYHCSVSNQSLQRDAIRRIKEVSDAKKAFNSRVQNLCTKLDTVMKKQLKRMTLGSFSEYRSQSFTHNYKIAFHFFEMYIKKQRLRKAMLAIKQASRNKLAAKLLKCTGRVMRRAKLRQILTRIFQVAERRRGLLKLHNLFRYKMMCNRQICGRHLLEHLENLRVWRRQKVKEIAKKGTMSLQKIIKRIIFRKVKEASDRRKQAIKLIAIKLELILLRGQKKAYQKGFVAIHKSMIKQKHLQQQMALVKKGMAASFVQAAFRMMLVRRWYKKLRGKVVFIQKQYRKFAASKKLRDARDHTLRIKQKQRMTQIRDTALQRLKSNMITGAPPLSKTPSNFSDTQTSQLTIKTPLRKVPHPVPKKMNDLQDLQDSVMQYSESIQTTAKVDRTQLRRMYTGKENLGPPLPSKQPHAMMKLNNDHNTREAIKHYKNKVIQNHMKEVSMKQTGGDSEDLHNGSTLNSSRSRPHYLPTGYTTSNNSAAGSRQNSLSRMAGYNNRSIQESVNTSVTHNQSVQGYLTSVSNSESIQVKRDNLHDLISGVKHKVKQIRRTERLFPGPGQ